jgi:hypothetical protein
MSLWSFRFLLWYICVLMVQPQNRFPFLWPLHIADISFIAALGLHLISALQERRPLFRAGPGTITALLLLMFGMISQYGGGPLQTSTGWNGYIDILVKNSLVLILIEATAFTVERVWAVQTTMCLASLWWVKGGLRLSAAGATYAGDRLMGPTVGLIENPNSFAYMMCVLIPLYLYFFQQRKEKVVRLFFLGLAISAVYIILETGSRTGMMALLVLGFFLLPRYGAKHQVALIAVGAAIVLILPFVGGKNIERFKSIPRSVNAFFLGEVQDDKDISQDEQSAQERRMKNTDTWALIKEYPIFGVGVNAEEGLYQNKFQWAVGQVHCEILMAGRQMGMIGMSLYIAFLAVLFALGRRVQKFTAGWWPDVSDLGWTFKMQTLVFIVGGAFSPLPWNAPELILVGSVSALWANVQEVAAATEAEGFVPAAGESAASIAPA